MNGGSAASKDVSNWQATQNQVFKVHFFTKRQPKKKHRLQGSKKTLASDGRMGTVIQLRKKNGVSAGAILLEFSKSYGYVIGRNGSTNDC